MENMDKMWKALFEILCMYYQPILVFFTHFDIIKSEINLKLKVKIKYMVFNGDNPYIHSMYCTVYI